MSDKGEVLKELSNGRFEATGADLLREAIVDWVEYNQGDDTFADWFPEAKHIFANRLYSFESDLEDIAEVEP